MYSQHKNNQLNYSQHRFSQHKNNEHRFNQFRYSQHTLVEIGQNVTIIFVITCNYYLFATGFGHFCNYFLCWSYL